MTYNGCFSPQDENLLRYSDCSSTFFGFGIPGNFFDSSKGFGNLVAVGIINGKRAEDESQNGGQRNGWRDRKDSFRIEKCRKIV